MKYISDLRDDCYKVKTIKPDTHFNPSLAFNNAQGIHPIFTKRCTRRVTVDQIMKPKENKMKMLNGNLLVEEVETETDSVLILPTEKNDIAIGKVVEDGFSSDLNIGDKVAFMRNYSKNYEHEGKELFVVRYEDLLAILD